MNINKFKIVTLLTISALLLIITPRDANAANTCNGACTSNFDCATNYVCLPEFGVCRGACNPNDAACGCVASATSTPTSTIASTPFPTPVTGNSWPTTLAIGTAVVFLLGSLFFAL